MKMSLAQRITASAIVTIAAVAFESAGCTPSSNNLGNRCPAPNYTFCCAVQWNPPGTKFPDGTLTEEWKVFSPNIPQAVAACQGSIIADNGFYDMRAGQQPIVCVRSPGGAACPNPARVLGPTSPGPILQSVDPKVKVIGSMAQGKIEAAAPGFHVDGLSCNDCANNASNTTCSQQLSNCDQDTTCATCVACLDSGGTTAACGCDVSDAAVASLGQCLLTACPQCSSSSSSGASGGSGAGGSGGSSLLPDGATCISSDECQSCVCDADTNTCATP